MNEERDSQLSAMFDGELPQAECELLARRLTRDVNLKTQWSRYALIGAALRGEPIQSAGSAGGKPRVLSVADRVAQSVGAAALQPADADSQDPAAPMRARLERWAQPVVGIGVAAGVAALSIFWLQARVTDNEAALVAQTGTIANAGEVVLGGVDLPDMRDNLSLVAAGAAGSAGAMPGVVSNGEPVRYTVPAADRNAGPNLAAGQFANYMVAHSEYAAPLNRRNVLSALIASESVLPLTPAPLKSVPAPAVQPAREQR
jgi:negative regulator of sigma E activity